VKKTYVLDANAVVSFIEAGPGSVRVQRLFEDALRQRCVVQISVLNWGEVFYLVWQRRGEETARQTMANLSRLPLNRVPLDLSLCLKAGEIKAIYKVPYVDSVAAALAKSQQATLVTADRDFENLGRHFPILWIARN
jgi:predicted nucleic acid-binding protein